MRPDLSSTLVPDLRSLPDRDPPLSFRSPKHAAMSLRGKAKKMQMQEAREKDRLRAAEEQSTEKAAAGRAEREREGKAREGLQGGPPVTGATPAAAAAASAAAVPRSAAPPPPLLDDDDEFGGIIPVRRIIRGGGAPAAAAAAVPAPAMPAAAASSSAASASSAASLPSVVPMLGSSSAAPTTNKLRTVFARESDEAIAARKALSHLPLVRDPSIFDAAGTRGGTPSTDYYSTPESQIPIPLRPDWTGKTAAQVEAQEQDYFRGWLEGIYARFPPERLNHFEHNLEVWRQLWRVCERSDILLVIVDARVPLLNFPPSLYQFITCTLRKPLVMVLNKIDLIPAGTVNDWIRFFAAKYPSMHVVPFTSFPAERQECLDTLVKSKAKRGKGRTLLKPFGAEQLLDACSKIVGSHAVAVPDAVKQGFSFDPTLLQGGSQSVEKNEQIYAGADDYMRAGSGGAGGDDDDLDLDSSSLSQELAQLGVLKNSKRDRALKRKQLAEINARHLSNLQTHSIAEEQPEEIDEDDVADAEAVAANSAKYSGALGLLEEDDQAASQRNHSFVTLGCLGMPNAGQWGRMAAAERHTDRWEGWGVFCSLCALTRSASLSLSLCPCSRRQIFANQCPRWSQAGVCVEDAGPHEISADAVSQPCYSTVRLVRQETR